ncbi:MAG: biopolymer transporter ExbD [Verrucomicrobiota bacterium]
MPRRRRQNDQVSFQITPMIDMTFLLLIFFMVTSTLSNEKIKMDVALPTSKIAKLPEDTSGRDIINIDRYGNFFVGNTKVDEAGLTAHLKSRFRNSPPLKVYLRGDAKTTGDKLNKFMKLASEAGAATILIGAHREN